MVEELVGESHTTLFDFGPETTPDVSTSTTPRIQEIDRRSPLPLYHQLYQILLHRIEAGEWKPDEAIPTEKELSQEYDVSRATVRQALQQLVSDNCLYRRHGLGTFVAKPKMRHGPQRPFGITGYLRAHGLQPGWHLLGMGKVIPPRPVAVALGSASNEEVLEIRRLRLADDEAIGVHTVYVPFPLAERIRPDHMIQGDSSLYYLEHILGVTLSESHRIIQAVPCDEDDAELLNSSTDCPLLIVLRITIGADGRPLEYLRAAYRGDSFEYYVHLEH